MVTTQFSATVLKNGVHRLLRGANMAGVFSRWWATQHGRQYSILTTLFGAFVILFLASLSQLLFLQESETWGEYTGAAIGLLVAAATGLIFVTPEFLVFKGHVSTLDELYEIRSTAELKRRRSEGDRSAAALGAGYEGRWNAFLQERGLRR